MEHKILLVEQQILQVAPEKMEETGNPVAELEGDHRTHSEGVRRIDVVRRELVKDSRKELTKEVQKSK